MAELLPGLLKLVLRNTIAFFLFPVGARASLARASLSLITMP